MTWWYSQTYDEYLNLIHILFLRAAEHSVVLNTSKIVFAKESIQFGEYVIDTNNFRQHPELTAAVRILPTPVNATYV